jgi:transposase
MPAKRRRRDPAKEKLWRGIIRRHKESGLSVRAFCEGERIKDCNFFRWRRELSRRDRERTTSLPDSATKAPAEPRVSPVFLPVRVVDADCAPSRPASPIEIVLDGGLTVRVPPGFDPHTLNDVLAVLEGRSC